MYSPLQSGPTAENSRLKMRAVVQRVSRARVTVEGSVTGEIAAGLMILLGVGRDDTSAVAGTMAEIPE